jgi:hypothetical protein
MILNRLKTTDRTRNKHYKDVRLLIDKDAFVAWFMANDFDGASVDRIDNTKDYTIDNIQMIPLPINKVKDRFKAKDGMCQCYRCKETKLLEYFAVDKRRSTGHSTICKKCDSNRKSHRTNRE